VTFDDDEEIIGITGTVAKSTGKYAGGSFHESKKAGGWNGGCQESEVLIFNSLSIKRKVNKIAITTLYNDFMSENITEQNGNARTPDGGSLWDELVVRVALVGI
nr:hypothetical protein [Tanacetum cinerariifolium]